MRKPNHLVFLFASSLMLLLVTSCGQGAQTESVASTDSLVIEEPKVIPLSEINIKGKWVSKDNPLYPVFEFKGKSSVLISTILGPIAYGYERDEEFIRIKADTSDLLLELVSEDSIIGSGWAKGLWIREQ